MQVYKLDGLQAISPGKFPAEFQRAFRQVSCCDKLSLCHVFCDGQWLKHRVNERRQGLPTNNEECQRQKQQQYRNQPEYLSPENKQTKLSGQP